MGIVLLVIIGLVIYAVIKSSMKENTIKYDSVPVTFQITTSFGYENEIDNSINSDDCWIPKNKPAIIKNITINDGMIYLGSGLSAVDKTYDIEPSLIDPKLTIKKTNLDLNRFDLGYWPSYRRLSPEERYTYLKWLAEGRKNPNVDIGFVFIFFYGLERRLLYDMKKSKTAQSEIYDIIVEVERLQSIYTDISSFNGYTSRLLDFIKAKHAPGRIKIGLPKEPNYGEIPLSLKVGLSLYCAEGKPIPPAWAFYWYQNYPYHRSLRTSAERCQKEFVDIYKKKFYEKYGKGLLINEPKSRLVISYKPASNSFSTTQTVTLSSLPDVVSLIEPLKEIEKIVEISTYELDAYSRFLGRNPDNKNDLNALSLLPKDIDIRNYSEKIIQLDNLIKDRLGEKLGVIFNAKELLKFWSFKSNDKISNNDNMSVINIFDRLGYSIEPDIRFTNKKINPSGKITIFKKPENSPESPTKEYKIACLIVTLALAVSSADGEISDKEKNHLANHIQLVLKLTKAERIRLSALFTYFIVEPPILSNYRKNFNDFDDKQRKSILQFLISIANADNKIESDEIKILKKIYKYFNYNPESIYSDIHSIQTAYANEPVVVKVSMYESENVYKIPNKVSQEEKSISLNKDRINDILKNTNKVVEILNDIFQEKDEISQTTKENISYAELDNIKNLDSDHSKIVRKLITKDIFPRYEFEDLCSSFKLMPNGVIEAINENFYKFYNDALIEDEEDLIINKEIVKVITNG
jgi:uncharacterized tellurite resistance protein B-like protein